MNELEDNSTVVLCIENKKKHKGEEGIFKESLKCFSVEELVSGLEKPLESHLQ